MEIGMPPSIVRKVKECRGMIPQEWADFISLHLSQKPEDAEKVANYLYRALKRLPAGSDGLHCDSLILWEALLRIVAA